MRLKSLSIQPVEIDGLGVEPLLFANHITQIHGQNGCGKTPLVKAIAYCLGFPSEFRNDIYERCKSATLVLWVENKEVKIVRQIAREFDVEVYSPSGIVERYLSEGEFSEYLFDLIRLKRPNLISSRGEVAKPYISTLLPLIYTDQDVGYMSVYEAPHKFIKDQFQEMVRLVFGLPSKNLFDKKKEKIESKKYLEFMDLEVKKKESILQLTKKNVLSVGLTHEEITDELDQLESQLEDITEHRSSKSQTLLTIERMIAQRQFTIREMEGSLLEISRRRNSIETMIDEISSETNALSLNEASREIFLSFQEICSNPNCGLLGKSSDSYAKNLLYLKDQIKDLTRTDAVFGREQERLLTTIKEVKKVVEELVAEKHENEENSEIEVLMSAFTSIKDRIFELQLQLSELDNLESVKSEYVSLLNKRNKALEQYESFSSEKSLSTDVAMIRANLRKAYIKWLDILDTQNVSRDITWRNEFEPILGAEKIQTLSGSTRIRAVLAFHAAVLDVLVADKGAMKLLILDSPKQHELSNEDLDPYFKALKQISEEGGVQIVFSTTEYKYDGDDDDTTWTPKHIINEQLMFLGQLG